MFIVLAVVVAGAVVAFKLLDRRVPEEIDIGGGTETTALMVPGAGASALDTVRAAVQIEENARVTEGAYMAADAPAIADAVPTMVWVDGGLPSTDTHIVSVLVTESGDVFVAAVRQAEGRCVFVRSVAGAVEHLDREGTCAASRAPVTGEWTPGLP